MLEFKTAKHSWFHKIQLDAAQDTTFVWVPGHSGVPTNEKAGQRRALLTNVDLADDSFRNHHEEIIVKALR